MFVKKKMKMKNRSYREDINTPHLDIDTSIANIRSLSVWYNFAKFTGKHLCQSLFFNKFFSSIAIIRQNN